mmetsp:Transcript_19221/g.19962  ORF Transcript_19221/g.19962 Transcript_19221/m.19962 type:complete len:339 (+) Transcript_19221:1-1017(+)
MRFLDVLQEKLGKHNPEDVDQLILDDLFENVRVLSDEQKEGIEKYKELRHLSLNNLGLACLKNFPNIPVLEVLEVRENLLTGKDFEIIAQTYPKLKKLKLGGNILKKFEYFDKLANSDILSIELFGTVLGNTKGYREILFHKMRSLESIDNTDRQGYHLDSDFYDELEDSFEEEDEDGEFVGNSAGEDEFDADFDDDEEDFELSQYDSNNDQDVKGEIEKKHVVKFSGKKKKRKDSEEDKNNIPNGKDRSIGKNSGEKPKKGKGKTKERNNEKNDHSEDDEVSISSSINPNRANKRGNINLVDGLLGKKATANEENLEGSKEEDDEDQMVMIKKIEKK